MVKTNFYWFPEFMNNDLPVVYEEADKLGHELKRIIDAEPVGLKAFSCPDDGVKVITDLETHCYIYAEQAQDCPGGCMDGPICVPAERA